ncbi:hypothetical protein HMPREF9260_00688 [Facklamia hominis ACS-120-V-Sch10]|nr:hypothetical protein HMPREF9260_00688 [Facklamia hominis ACS-120-V-Sch10]
MWVEELSNGKFKYCERYLDHKTGKNRRISITLDKNTPQAKNYAIKMLNKKIESTKTETKKIRLGELTEEYIAFKKKHWALSTYNKNLGFYKRHIQPYPEHDFYVCKLTLNDIQRIIDRVQYDKGLARNTIINIKSLIGSVLNYGYDEYDIEFVKSFDRVFIKEELPKELPIINSDEIPKLIEDMRSNINELYADAVEVQILTGMRIGELRALTEEDWFDNKIRINKSIERKTNAFSKPKNIQSIRTIDSSDRINEIFERRIKLNHLLFGDEANLIFASKLNGPLTYTYFQELIKRVNPELSSHVFRHTHVSLLAEKGFPLKYIMERVGHTNPETTMKVYTHVTERMQKEARDKLNNLI